MVCISKITVFWNQILTNNLGLKKYAALPDATTTDELLVLLSAIETLDSLRCPDYSRFNLKELVKLFISLERLLEKMNSIILSTHSFR